jgi:hypothetical protein
MPQHRIVAPPGVDRNEFRAFHRKALLELSRDAKKFHSANLKKGRLLTSSAAESRRLLKTPRKDAKALLESYLKSDAHKQIVKRGPRSRGLRGHNPARYAPYQFPWASLNAGGIGGGSLYPVDPNSGEVGANLIDVIGGSGSAASAMGFWYQAQSTGSLFVSAQLWVSWGAAEVYALPGYATANAFVKVFVQQWRPWYSLSAQSTIWDRSSYGFGIDVETGIEGNYSAGITVPVVAGGWYALWGALYQHVTAGGIASAVSNFDAYVGPITYVEV